MSQINIYLMESSCVKSEMLLTRLMWLQRGSSSLRVRHWIWTCSSVGRRSMSREHSCWNDSASPFTAVKLISTSDTCPIFKVRMCC